MKRFGICSSNNISSDKTATFGNVRISVITDRILRVESSADGVFEDRPTQTVLDRNFTNTKFTIDKKDDKVLVLTKSKVFSVDTNTLEVRVKRGEKWVREKDGRNLKGTARTLDFSWGKWQLPSIRVDMGKGLFSTVGVAEFDDSLSM